MADRLQRALVSLEESTRAGAGRAAPTNGKEEGPAQRLARHVMMSHARLGVGIEGHAVAEAALEKLGIARLAQKIYMETSGGDGFVFLLTREQLFGLE